MGIQGKPPHAATVIHGPRVSRQLQTAVKTTLVGRERTNAASDGQSTLLAAVGDLAFARDLDRITEIVRSAARRLTAADGVTFVLKEDEHCYYADEDAIAPLWKGRRLPLETCISGWVMTHRQPAVIQDIYADPRIPHDVYRHTFVKSLLMVPVRVEDPIAAIGAYWATDHEATDEERTSLENLARAASLALMNVQSWTDLQRAFERERAARVEAERARAEADRANASKDQFLATVSHELRNPLNVMQGSIWRLKESTVPPEQTSHALDVLHRNAALQARLVDDLLEVSRAVTAKLNIEHTVVDLTTTCRMVVESAGSRAKDKRLELSYRHHGATLVWGDSERLQEVVLNLIENAIKFTPEGGRVDVRVDRTRTTACLTVQDTGVGVSPDFLPQMFEIFRQADPSPTRDHGGLGIGLTIAQQIVRLHNGTIHAESDGPNRGTTIRVELPLSTHTD